MPIDLRALTEACLGDPDKKVTVSKKWLQEVLSELSDLEKRRRLDRAARAHADEINKHFEETDRDIDRIFERQDGLFDRIFGKKGLFGRSD